MLLGERHEGQYAGLGAVHEGRELGHSGTELVGDRAPLFARRVGFGERGADPG